MVFSGLFHAVLCRLTQIAYKNPKTYMYYHIVIARGHTLSHVIEIYLIYNLYKSLFYIKNLIKFSAILEVRSAIE